MTCSCNEFLFPALQTSSVQKGFSFFFFSTCLVTQTTWTKKKRKKRTRIALTYAGTVHDMMILSSTRVFERERVIFFVAEPTMYIYIDILDDTFNHITLLFFIHLLEILTVRYMMCTIYCTNDSGVVVL